MISIVIATFNSSKTILATLESIAIQSGCIPEVVIVDGASTDSTVFLAKSFTQLSIVILSEPDKGIFDAWNKGIKLSTREWILFLGSDDVISNESSIAEASVGLSQLSDTKTLAHASITINGLNGRSIRGSKTSLDQSPYDAFCSTPVPGLFFRRSLFQSRQFDTNFKIAGDLDFLLRLYGEGLRSEYLQRPQSLVNFNMGGASTDFYRIPKILAEFELIGKRTRLISTSTLLKTKISMSVKFYLNRLFGAAAILWFGKTINRIPILKKIWIF